MTDLNLNLVKNDLDEIMKCLGLGERLDIKLSDDDLTLGGLVSVSIGEEKIETILETTYVPSYEIAGISYNSGDRWEPPSVDVDPLAWSRSSLAAAGKALEIYLAYEIGCIVESIGEARYHAEIKDEENVC